MQFNLILFLQVQVWTSDRIEGKCISLLWANSSWWFGCHVITPGLLHMVHWAWYILHMHIYTHINKVSWNDFKSRIISPRLWSSPLCMMFCSHPFVYNKQAWKQHYKETEHHESMFQEPTKPGTFNTAFQGDCSRNLCQPFVTYELIRRFPAFAGPSGLEFGLLWVLYLARFDKNFTLCRWSVQWLQMKRRPLVEQPWWIETT